MLARSNFNKAKMSSWLLLVVSVHVFVASLILEVISTADVIRAVSIIAPICTLVVEVGMCIIVIELTRVCCKAFATVTITRHAGCYDYFCCSVSCYCYHIYNYNYCHYYGYCDDHCCQKHQDW